MRAVVAKAPEPGAADSAARKAHVQLQGVRHNGRVVRASAEHVWPVAPADPATAPHQSTMRTRSARCMSRRHHRRRGAALRTACPPLPTGLPSFTRLSPAEHPPPTRPPAVVCPPPPARPRPPTRRPPTRRPPTRRLLTPYARRSPARPVAARRCSGRALACWERRPCTAAPRRLQRTHAAGGGRAQQARVRSELLEHGSAAGHLLPLLRAAAGVLFFQGGLQIPRAQLQHGLLAHEDVLAARGAQRHGRLQRRLRPAAGRNRAWARGARGEGPQLPGPAPPQLLSDRGSSSPPPRPLAALAPSRAPQGRAAGGWSGTVPTFPHQRPTPPLPPQSLSQYEQDATACAGSPRSTRIRAARRRRGLQRS